MARWGASDETQCNAAIARVCESESESEGAGAARVAAWRELVLTIAPHVERWSDRSWLLRSWRLQSEDSSRAILVEILTRLSRHEYANLGRYRARSAPTELTSGDTQLEAIERVALLREDTEQTAREQEAPEFPFRAWLLRLLSYVVKDYIRERLGWAHDAGGPSKRDLGSEAARLSNTPEPGSRPPFTDYVHVRRLLADVEVFAETFPEAMRRALAAWVHGASYVEIAETLGLGSPDAAEKLVRAAKARLREHFRESAL